MTPSAYKILSRFEKDKKKAIQYCETLAEQYPRLRAEYREYVDVIRAYQPEETA